MVFRLLQNAFMSLKIEITHFYSSSLVNLPGSSHDRKCKRKLLTPLDQFFLKIRPPPPPLAPPPSPARGEGEETMKLILSIVKE